MADRLVPTSATPGTVTGDAYMDAVADEIGGLWNRSICTLDSVGGSANALTATLAPALTSGLVDGMAFWLTPANNNTGAATISINGASAVDIVNLDGDPLVTGNLANGRKYLLVADDGALRIVSGSGGAGGSGGFNVVIFTSSGTYTKPNGLRFAEILVRAAGGGSGGKSNESTPGLSWSGGGGGGGEATKFMEADDIGGNETVTVGAGGTAGGTGLTAIGGTGGSSSFGSHCVATGGVGGRTLSGSQDPAGGAPGIGTVGDTLSSGYPGAYGSYAGTFAERGVGGGSPTGGGGAAARTAAGDGVDGNPGTGAGATGAAGTGATTRLGGVGGSGIVIIREYF